MRIIRVIRDLPWWTGFPIIMIGNLVIPYDMWGITIGCFLYVFGCWVFSKLLIKDEYASGGRAILCFPIALFILWIFNNPIDLWLCYISEYKDLYMIRLFLALPFGLIGSQGLNLR
jgi:hypothetical protein